MTRQTAIASVLALAAALTIAACAELQQAAETGQQVATQAAEAAPTLQALAQTAQAAAPTLQAQAGDLRQTAEALAPTLQALQPTIEAALPTLQAALPTAQAALPTFEALLPTLQASGLQQTAEAYATALPELQGDVRATAAAYATERVGGAPADIPVPPRSSVIYTSERRLVYTTELTPGAVRELYEVDMPAAGWALVPVAAEQGEAVQLQFERPGRRAAVAIAPAPGGSGVEVTVTDTVGGRDNP